ncbi:DUF2167 domain-containing protein [Pseudoxanthomonas indica]|uniref:Uncharacterized membrane-anchored protein n=1 Tax=Pseudoxanthomonas indica TaxID=428993 RepID=A0A1T5KI24_9GAMM|nr:hypothetical protein GCM10007235_21870 [Pseudoxanthomonas indica]SKC63394.1 Uncharacterized membrane-anchored protein [Pseudoxanthomonas indica]
MWLGGLVVALGMGLAVAPAPAQEGNAEDLLKQLDFHGGDIAVPGAHARFHLDDKFQYLQQADARRVLEQLWGNPPDESVLGLIVPKQPGLLEDGSWAVVVTYSDDGYVSDEDAAKIDYAELLEQLQEETRDSNAARKEAGYGTVDLAGWAETPRYDAASKKLYWAKDLAFNGEAEHTLNYDIRVLGRHGYLSLNAVAGMSDLPAVRTGMQELLPMAEFDAGSRYADFNESTDKTAAYGVAALIGGGLAAKAGLFAKLGLVLAKFWKLLLIGGVVVVSGVRKLFAKKPASTVS